MQADIQTLRQQGLKLRIITVPGVILTNVLDVALTATKMPIHHTWVHLDFRNT